MLPWVCKVIDHRKHQNVTKTLQVGAWGGVSRRLPSLQPIFWPIHRHPPKEFYLSPKISDSYRAFNGKSNTPAISINYK